jgi:hypothetical protein
MRSRYTIHGRTDYYLIDIELFQFCCLCILSTKQDLSTKTMSSPSLPATDSCSCIIDETNEAPPTIFFVPDHRTRRCFPHLHLQTHPQPSTDPIPSATQLPIPYNPHPRTTRAAVPSSNPGDASPPAFSADRVTQPTHPSPRGIIPLTAKPPKLWGGVSWNISQRRTRMQRTWICSTTTK